MELPIHLHADHVPDDTAIVGNLSLDDWCTQYVDSGLCRTHWRLLHTAALRQLYADELTGASHGFALAEGDAIWLNFAREGT